MCKQGTDLINNNGNKALQNFPGRSMHGDGKQRITVGLFKWNIMK